MPSNKEVGIVVLLKLRLEAQPGFPDLDWHCGDVQVRRSSEDPEVEVFPCHKWIRTADGNVELRNAKKVMCLKKKETLAILTNHRERDLPTKTTVYQVKPFLLINGPHCVDMSSVTALGPNFSYIRQRYPVNNVHYIKSFIERRTSWSSLQELETFFLFNGRENTIAKYVQAHWQEDAFFGYQCLNGCNPLCIRQIHNLPPNLSVTSEMVRPFLPEDSSLEQEMEGRHVYLLDYEVLDQLPANTVNDKQTYLAAPLCLLHYSRQGELKPIAIQVKILNRFLLILFWLHWLLAKMWVRNSDFQVHQLLSHFLRTHLIGEVCCTAALRQLPEIHPLHQVETKFSSKNHAVLTLTTRLLLFSCGESSPEGQGVPQSFQTAAEMCKFVTMVIFSCSALHAAVNFSQVCSVINKLTEVPAAMSRPPSQTKGSVSEEDIFSFLPEVNSSCHVLSVLSLLSQPAIDFVPLCSGATVKLVEEVWRELKMIAKDIADRNSQLELPYTYLSPDHIENSVTI
uniref:Lipoxygenase domain-containing protein n=1 Tax=Sinocyclocheilus rhinocerous TaxID=307959 RepID=A0A673M1I7_9TELE